MRHRDRIGLTLPPLFLRLLLGLVFLQAGLGKVMSTMEVDAARAAAVTRPVVLPASSLMGAVYTGFHGVA